MKYFMILLFLVLANTAMAINFVIPELNTKLDAIDAAVLLNTTSRASSGTALAADGVNQCRVAKASWDFDVDGGAIGAIDLGVNLPAKSLINLVYIYTVTQVTDGGVGTGALSCEDANNLFSAADITGNAAGVVVDGIPQNGSANIVKAIAAECALTWTIAGSAATAGALDFFVHYCVHN